MLDSTVNYTDARGYEYVGMSPSWKKLCLFLPCSERVKIPPIYATQWINAQIDDQDVVIQAWKGDCFHAARGLPGGIGGEGGIYRKDPTRTFTKDLQIPMLDDFPEATRPLITAIVSDAVNELVELAEAGVELWWPFPELNAAIEMSFTEPRSSDAFFVADPPEPAGGYWMSRWMSYGSYEKYAAHRVLHGHAVPVRTCEYTMNFAVKGHRYRWAGPASKIVQV